MHESPIPESFSRKIRKGRFVATIYRDNVLFLASALSFDALLAAIPLALLVIAVLGEADLLKVVEVVMPTQAGNPEAPLSNAERIMNSVVASRRELSLYGIPLFLVFSTRLFSSARIALDQVRGVKTRRRFVHDMAYDILLVLVTTTLFAANSLMSLPAFGFAGIDRFLAHLAAIGFGTVLFFSVYFLAPTRKLEWRTALLVAAIVSIIFEVSKVLFGTYLVQFATVNRVISHANAIAVLLFVFWIYLTALLFLMGGELAKAVEERRQRVAGEHYPERRLSASPRRKPAADPHTPSPSPHQPTQGGD
jgi:membrane protein